MSLLVLLVHRFGVSSRWCPCAFVKLNFVSIFLVENFGKLFGYVCGLDALDATAQAKRVSIDIFFKIALAVVIILFKSSNQLSYILTYISYQV